jgi:hypothetical protein
MRRPSLRSLAALVALLSLGSAARAATIVIDNGLAPPNPANVIDHTTYASDSVQARDSSSGDPTIVELTDGGEVNSLQASDHSEVQVTGGLAAAVLALGAAGSFEITGGTVYQAAVGLNGTGSIQGGTFTSIHATGGSLTMTGGETYSADTGDASYLAPGELLLLGGTVTSEVTVNDNSSVLLDGATISTLRVNDNGQAVVQSGHIDAGILAANGAIVTWSGGTIGSGAIGTLSAYNVSTIEVVGTGFALDGEPIPFGPLPASYGILTGTLASGEAFQAGVFNQDPYGVYNGTIVVVAPEPQLAGLLASGAIVLLAGRKGAGGRIQRG